MYQHTCFASCLHVNTEENPHDHILHLHPQIWRGSLTDRDLSVDGHLSWKQVAKQFFPRRFLRPKGNKTKLTAADRFKTIYCADMAHYSSSVIPVSHSMHIELQSMRSKELPRVRLPIIHYTHHDLLLSDLDLAFRAQRQVLRHDPDRSQS